MNERINESINLTKQVLSDARGGGGRKSIVLSQAELTATF